jgi:outer membrane lipoprotein SlyB
MNCNQNRLWIASVAGAVSCAALAQDYRYQTPPPPAQTQAQPVQQVQQQAAPPVLCTSCGTVDAIRTIEKPGEASGVGMVAGGVLGGLVGHQIGQGRGNTAATIVGAAGGAYAGHQVEKNIKKVVHYDISVRMDDGTLRTVSYDVEPGFRTGDKVRFVDGRLTRN